MPKSPTPLGPPTAPAAFCATPQYYHPASCPPTCPGWYFCQCRDRVSYLVWREDAFWDGDCRVGDVSHWVELPGFVQRLLSQP